MEENPAGHFSFLPAATGGMLVEEAQDLTLADSGLPTDTFNAVCNARLQPGSLVRRMQAAIGHFWQRNLPFSWWVGPLSEPADLERTRLRRKGVRDDRRSPFLARACLDSGGTAATQGFERGRALRLLAGLAANWDPPDWAVPDFYASTAKAVLDPDCPVRLFAGYSEEESVAASECFTWTGVAGVYNVVTLSKARGRGFGSALASAALREAREVGHRTAVFQASAGASTPG